MPQPRYPFTLHRKDAIDFPLDGFDLVHASPPCRDHTRAAGGKYDYNGTGWMLSHMLARLAEEAEGDWVVENVEGAPFGVPTFKLCGSSFGLDLRRHRRFACSRELLAPKCDHVWQTPRFPSLNSGQRKAGKLSPVVGVHGHLHYPGELDVRKRAMGIDWMNAQELNDALPPAYTEWIGSQLRTLAHQLQE